MGVFDKAIIPPTLLGYEMIIANSYPVHTRGIIFVYVYYCSLFSYVQRLTPFFELEQPTTTVPTGRLTLHFFFTITTTDVFLLCCETIMLHCGLRFLSSMAFSMFRVIWSTSWRPKQANYVNVSEPRRTWCAHAGKKPFGHTEHWALDISSWVINYIVLYSVFKHACSSRKIRMEAQLRLKWHVQTLKTYIN